MSANDEQRFKAQQDWIQMNKVRLDQIERAKRRDFRLLLVINLINLGLIIYSILI